MPIGLTPGHLSRGIRQQAMKALIPSGLTREVHCLRPTAAKEEHRYLEADLYDKHNLRQTKASRPDRPAAPFVLNAALRIRLGLRLVLSKIIGLGIYCSPGRNTSVHGGVLAAGCFLPKISRTVHSSLVPVFTLSSKFITPFELPRERVWRAPCTLPSLIFFANN